MRIESAGLIGPNRCSPTKAVVVAADRGVDLSAHRSKLLSADAVGAAGLLVVMNRLQRGTVRRRFQVDRARVIVLGDLDGAAGDGRGIADPVDQPREMFEECYDRIDSCVGSLVFGIVNGGSGWVER